jgi:hypothetical protein
MAPSVPTAYGAGRGPDVGDDAWLSSSDRNGHFMPNLVGLDIDTMRYNGKSAYMYRLPTTLLRLRLTNTYFREQAWVIDSRLRETTSGLFKPTARSQPYLFSFLSRLP